MNAEGTLVDHIDFLHWEIDGSAREIKQYGYAKDGVTDQGQLTDETHIIMNRAARDIDGLVGVETVTDMCQVNFILIMDLPAGELSTEELSEHVKTNRRSFAKRYAAKAETYVPLTEERVMSGMAVHATSSYQDKIQARSR
jgi:hypothetical protein